MSVEVSGGIDTALLSVQYSLGKTPVFSGTWSLTNFMQSSDWIQNHPQQSIAPSFKRVCFYLPANESSMSSKQTSQIFSWNMPSESKHTKLTKLMQN